MQVNFNPTTSKIAFKAPKNNNATNYTYLNNQVSFGDSYNSHTRKGKFDKLIQKLGISKKEADVSLIQVFEIDSHQCSELNNMSAQMMEYYSRKCGVDPFEDLFIAKYKDSCNHPVVVFNCFSSDINDNNRIQLFVIESDMQE